MKKEKTYRCTGCGHKATLISLQISESVAVAMNDMGWVSWHLALACPKCGHRPNAAAYRRIYYPD